MSKISTLLAALLFGAAFAAQAQTSSNSQGAASVTNAPAQTKSGGHADKGLDNAEANITKKHKHTGKHKGAEEKTEHAHQHVARAERPSRPERPGR